METRKITIVETKNQKKSVIMSEATTLAELKRDLANNGINYNGMTFYEGTSKTELINDSSVLPHDVPYKGTITNELVFMLTNTNKKIKSGVMTRHEVYQKIKELGLQDRCNSIFGKNFTMCKTQDLIKLIEDFTQQHMEKENISKTSEVCTCKTNNTKVEDTAARKAIMSLVNTLYYEDVLDDEERDTIIGFIKEGTGNSEKLSNIDSPYSDNEIDNMIHDMNL